MIIHVRLFARARDLARTDRCDVELADGATVADLRHRLAADYPALTGLLERSVLAVENDFADDARVLPPNAEVALLPPVSGGNRAKRGLRDGGVIKWH
jgi:molybdopterin converting factor subunit 1